jgi:hypothetical protein
LWVSACRRVRQLTNDNQMYLQKLIEMKDEQAEAFNQANKIFMEAQRIKNENIKSQRLEEEKGVFGQQPGEVDLQQFIKGEYLLASPFIDIKVPSKVEMKIPAHKQEATCLCFNTIGD